MRKIINPKTNKPYSQAELQEAYEEETELKYFIKVPDGELLLSNIPHKEYINDKNGFEKEVHSL